MIIFVLAYMIVCSILALMQGNNEFLMYAVVMVVIITIVMLFHLRIRFSPTTMWLLAIWGFLHMCGGTIPVSPKLTDAYRAATSPDQYPTSAVLYSLRLHPSFIKYDQFVHTFGFFSATLACFEGLRVLLRAPKSFATVFAAALMGIGLGATNEIVEFVAVLIVPETNVGGYINTGWDLVANAIGASLAGVWCLWRKD